MGDTMVTGRMTAEKKAAATRVLERENINASKAINLLYDKIIQEGSASFLYSHEAAPQNWLSAAQFVDALASPTPIKTRFDTMTHGEIKLERARAKGLLD